MNNQTRLLNIPFNFQGFFCVNKNPCYLIQVNFITEDRMSETHNYMKAGCLQTK